MEICEAQTDIFSLFFFFFKHCLHIELIIPSWLCFWFEWIVCELDILEEVSSVSVDGMNQAGRKLFTSERGTQRQPEKPTASQRLVISLQNEIEGEEQSTRGN